MDAFRLVWMECPELIRFCDNGKAYLVLGIPNVHERLQAIDGTRWRSPLGDCEQPMSAQALKPPGHERPVFVLDVLMGIRDEARRGRPFWFFFGAERAEMMWAYIVGYVDCCYRNGFTDEEWGRFMDWLSDVKNEFPEGGGWVKKFLDDCGGDQGKAMMKFLDLVAEFVATRRG